MLINMDQPVWAWAEPNALHLLDFWAEFESAIRFVLVAETPAQALLRQAEDAPFNTEHTEFVLRQWQEVHQTMLHFALRHPLRCALVWGHEAKSHPEQLVAHLSGRWELPWQLGGVDPSDNAMPCPLAQHLALNLSKAYPAVQQLMDELQACITPLQSPQHQLQDPAELLVLYHSMQKEALRTRQIASLQGQLQEAMSQRQSAREQLNAIEAEHAQTRLRLDETTAALQQAKAVAERLYGFENDLAVARQQLQEKNQQIQRWESQITEQNEKSLALRTELEAKTQSLNQIQSQHGQLAQQIQKLEETLDQVQQQRTELQAESDQLLAQLHETQEELESYCIQNDALEKQMGELADLQKRWHQLFENHRDLYAVRTVHIEPAASEEQRYRVQLTGLHMAGRYFEQLEIGIGIDPQGCASLSVLRPPAEQAHDSLLRWPVGIQAGHSLELHPGNGIETSAERIAIFMQLSTSDWQLSQDLPRLLLTALDQTRGNLTPFDEIQLKDGLRRYLDEARPLRKILRFDSAWQLFPADAVRVCLQLSRVTLDHLSVPELELTLERPLADDVHAPTTLSLMPNTLFGNSEVMVLKWGVAGWQNTQCEPLVHDQLGKLLALLSALPLALVDAVHNGADKAQIKTWVHTVRQLRESKRSPSSVANTSTTPKAPKRNPKQSVTSTPRQKDVDLAKTTSQDATKAKRSVTRSHSNEPVALTSIAKHPVKTRRKTRA